MVSGDNGVERKATFIGQKKNQQNKTRKCCSVFFVAAAKLSAGVQRCHIGYSSETALVRELVKKKEHNKRER